MEDLLLHALKFVKAEYAEARYHSIDGITLILRNGQLEGVELIDCSGVGIRVLDKALGFACSSSLNKEALRATAKRACKLAKVASRINLEKTQLSVEQCAKAKHALKPRLPFEDVSLEERVEFLLELDKLCNLTYRLFELSCFWTHKLLLTSEGTCIESSIPRIFLGCRLTATQGKDSEQASLEWGASGGWEVLKQAGLQERVEHKLKALQSALRAKKLPKGKYGVVLGNEVVGIAVHESAGHPCEADRILGKEAAQAGESFLDAQNFGQTIGSDVVSIADDPTLQGSFGYYEWDDEGIKARRKLLICQGRINEFLLDRQSAAKLGLNSNGAARASEYDKEPLVRMSNTFMLPGDLSFEELLEGIKRGIYIQSYGEWNIDDRRWNMRIVGEECYLIENGELGRPVRRPVLELSTPEFYSSIQALDQSLEFFAGWCGKGDPLQAVPVWMGGPKAKLKSVWIK